MDANVNNIVEIRDLFASYRNKCVLEGISFDIKNSDFIALIGPNGGGKTTLLRIIAGLKTMDSGNLIFPKWEYKAARKKIGYIPQSSLLQNDFPIRVLDAISMAFVDNMKPFLRFRSTQKTKIEATMQSLDLLGIQHKSISELSGGQLQRVLIARALVTEPELLLLDEPFAHLDSASRNSLVELLEMINHNHAIVLTTHDYGIMPQSIRSVGFLNKRMEYFGPPRFARESRNQFYQTTVNL